MMKKEKRRQHEQGGEGIGDYGARNGPKRAKA
jgi:hypothetical protein